MKILAVGGYDQEAGDKIDEISAFCRILAKEIIGQGHVLVNGCQTEFDRVTAQAAHEELQAERDPQPERRLISYVLSGTDPAHDYGKRLQSRLTSWDPGAGMPYVPEPISEADVVILVRGFKGTFRAAHWAEHVQKPLLPVAYFGGAAAEIYKREFDRFKSKHGTRVESFEYQTLVAVDKNWPKQATEIVSLAEKLAVSRTVLVIMSYTSTGKIGVQLENVYDSFDLVCKEFDCECKLVNETNTVDDRHRG